MRMRRAVSNSSFGAGSITARTAGFADWAEARYMKEALKNPLANFSVQVFILKLSELRTLGSSKHAV